MELIYTHVRLVLLHRRYTLHDKLSDSFFTVTVIFVVILLKMWK